MVTTNVYDMNGVKIGTLYFDEYDQTYFVSAESGTYDYYEDTDEFFDKEVQQCLFYFC